MFKRFLLVVVLVCVGSVRAADDAPKKPTKKVRKEDPAQAGAMTPRLQELGFDARTQMQAEMRVAGLPTDLQNMIMEREKAALWKDTFAQQWPHLFERIGCVNKWTTENNERVKYLAWALGGEQLLFIGTSDYVEIREPLLERVRKRVPFFILRGFAIDADGTQFVAADHNTPTTVYSVSTGKILQTLGGDPYEASWDDGKNGLLAIVSRGEGINRTLTLWDVNEQRMVSSVDRFEGLRIGLNQIGSGLAYVMGTGRSLRVLAIGDAGGLGEARVLVPHDYGRIHSFSWNASGSSIVFSGKGTNYQIKIIGASDGQQERILAENPKYVYDNVSWCHEGRGLIASVSAFMDEVRIWSPENGRCLAILPHARVGEVCWGPKGLMLATATQDLSMAPLNQVKIWNVESIIELEALFDSSIKNNISRDLYHVLALIEADLATKRYATVPAEQLRLLDGYPELKKLLIPFIRVDYSSALKRARGHTDFDKAIGLLSARENGNEEMLNKYTPKEQREILQRGLQLQNDIVHSDELRRRFENAIRAVEAALAPGGAAGAE